MKTKILEIRDCATFIPAIAVEMTAADDIERYYLGRAGYADHGRKFIMLTNLNGGRQATSDPFDWAGPARTWHVAHRYIEEHWEELKTGDVVCVETIVGERQTPKISERLLP